MKIKKTLVVCLIIIGLLFLFNIKCYAGYSFTETAENIDKIKAEISTETYIENQLLGFNFISTPYIIILLYFLIQLLLIIKHKKDITFDNIKMCLKNNIIVFLLILLVNVVISYFIPYQSENTVYSNSNAFLSFIFAWSKIINIVINSFILIFGLIYDRKILYKDNLNNFNDDNDLKEKYTKQNRKMIITIATLLIVLSFSYFFINFINKEPSVHIVERDWSFGITFDVRQYDIKIDVGKNIFNSNFLVKEIDNEGVLLEYTRNYYESNPKSNDNNSSSLRLDDYDYEYKTETVQQKMKWNVNYSYHEARHPLLCVDGGTNYYIRFEK